MFVKILADWYDETKQEVFINIMQISAVEKTKGIVRMANGNGYGLTKEDMDKLTRMLEEE